MKPELIAVAVLFLGYVLAELALTSFVRKPNQKAGDASVEIVSTIALALLIQPLVAAGGFLLGMTLLPNSAGMLQTSPFILVFCLFLIFDDLTQYWWHRLSHSVGWLYKLHRPHHNAEYLSIRMVYRNNLFYYCLMPGLWCSGVLVYLGGGWVYAFYIVIKMAVIFGAHSDVRWDKHLYSNRWSSKVMWLVERVISTPTTHAAHHGKHADDGVTHYKGNYGNLLFFWDIVFGTAKITRQYPTQFGVEGLQDTSVAEQLIWPIVSLPNQSKIEQLKTGQTL